MKKWSVWRVLILLTFTLLALLVFLFSESHTIPKEKASFMEMLVALSPARTAVEKCWAEQRANAANCPAAKALMPKPVSSNVTYLMTAEGTLLGMDYESHVAVIFSATVEGGSLIWHCAGSPQTAVTKQCNGTVLENLSPG